jgi:hypothetical protein
MRKPELTVIQGFDRVSGDGTRGKQLPKSRGLEESQRGAKVKKRQ